MKLKNTADPHNPLKHDLVLVFLSHTTPVYFSNYNHAFYYIYLYSISSFTIKNKKIKIHSLNLSGSISKRLKLDLFARIRSETPVTAGKLHKCTSFLLLDLLQSIQWCFKQKDCLFEKKVGMGLGVHQQTCPSAINNYSRPSVSGLHKENNLFPIIS